MTLVVGKFTLYVHVILGQGLVLYIIEGLTGVILCNILQSRFFFNVDTRV